MVKGGGPAQWATAYNVWPMMIWPGYALQVSVTVYVVNGGMLPGGGAAEMTATPPCAVRGASRSRPKPATTRAHSERTDGAPDALLAAGGIRRGKRGTASEPRLAGFSNAGSFPVFGLTAEGCGKLFSWGGQHSLFACALARSLPAASLAPTCQHAHPEPGARNATPLRTPGGKWPEESCGRVNARGARPAVPPRRGWAPGSRLQSRGTAR